MKRHLCTTIVSLVVLSLAACGDDNGKKNPDAPQVPDAAMPDAPPPPPSMPALGTQIDRAGRPAISTALVATFEVDDSAKGMTKDMYNADGARSGWATAWSTEIAKNLGVLDSLDATCANQFLANADPTYATLAGVLASDLLWVDSAKGTCEAYLAVEQNFLGGNLDDCGGRTPTMDVIDISYSLLAAGVPAGVTDGVDTDPDGTYDLDTFPFLLAPTN